MKRLYILGILFLGVLTIGFSQKSLNDYSYVVVPEQFEFLDAKDKYQLNSISNFLFNKHGFHSFLSDDTPDAKRCDGLYANLERGKAFLKTKFTIVLKDCNGNEIYRSPEGVSKLKEFKKAYQDALRRAFKNIEALNVQQKEITLYNARVNTDTIDKKVVNEELKKDSTATVTSEVLRVEVVEVNSIVPQAKFSNYTYNGKSYLLRKTAEGYTLYEENNTTEDGLLVIGKIERIKDSKILFIDASEKVFKAHFDDAQNLMIEKMGGVEVYKLER